jgi:carbonic anhydrase/acetyltransferase-like protein (isoleucine patch superfamily)
MQIFSYKETSPNMDDTNYVSATSVLIGKVKLESFANVWFGTVVRADVNRILIGENTNIQDLCMLHVTEKDDLIIGKNVSVGHSVVLHGCEIGDGCLIGMGSKILDGAIIGKNCLVAAGSVVPPNKVYEEGSFIIGTPAKVKRKLSGEEIESISNHYKAYLKYGEEFKSDDVVDLSKSYLDKYNRKD